MALCAFRLSGFHTGGRSGCIQDHWAGRTRIFSSPAHTHSRKSGKISRVTRGRYLSSAAHPRAAVVGACTAGLREGRSLGSGC